MEGQQADPMSMTGSTGSTGSTAGVPLGDGSASADIVAQARGRSDGFRYDDERAIGSPPNWASKDAEELYNGAVMNNDPSSAEALGQGWLDHGRELNQAANDLYNAISELGAAWVGQSAGAAQGTLVAIANSSSQASEAAQTMGQRMQQQAVAAAELKKMPKVEPFDPKEQLNAMIQGGPAALTPDLKAKYDAMQSGRAQQIQFYEAFTKAMSEVDNSTPSFGPDSLGLKPAAPGVGGHGGSVGAVAGPAGVPGGAPGVGSFGAGAHGVVAAPGSVDTSVNASGYAGGAAVPGGAGLGAGASMGAAAAGPAPSPAAGGGAAAGLGAAGVGGALGYAGGRALGQGNRSGSKQQKQTDETSASLNQGQGSSAATVAPQQNQGVVSPGGTIGGGQTPPPAGAPMGGGMGAGMRGGQSEGEEEHTHASFLIEPDPDDAFGANEATPPPVIGAWGNDSDDGDGR